MPINNSSTQSSSTTTLSMENQLMDFYLGALKDFSNIWLNGTDADDVSQKIALQFMFLVQTIPSETIRNKIWTEQGIQKKRLESEGHSNAYAKSTMIAVSAVVEFLASTFDLMHEDILGPATSKQYKDAVLELPDMPVVSTEQPPISIKEQ